MPEVWRAAITSGCGESFEFIDLVARAAASGNRRFGIWLSAKLDQVAVFPQPHPNCWREYRIAGGELTHLGQPFVFFRIV